MSIRLRRLRDALLMALIVLCVFALIASQIYLSVHGSENTQDAVLYTCKESISFTGVIVRDETVIYSQRLDEGVMNYAVSDGARLSKDSTIARIYDSYTQVFNRYRIDRLTEELENLRRAQDPGTTDYAQPEFINKQVAESYKNLLLNLTEGELDSVYDDSLEMLKLMNIYNIASNIESDYSERIAELTAELDNLNAALKEPIATINTTSAGYFTSVVDGYENELKLENIGDMTVDQIKDIIAHPDKTTASHNNAVGKVFNSYSWKMVGIIDVADRYFVNEELQFSIDSSEETHTVFVESITPTGNGNEAIIIISCDELDSELARSRVADVELTFVEETGIRAPRVAIRFVGADKGVYVMVGEKVEFKKLKVIYEGDDYVLSENTSDSEYLNLYDRIVIDPISAISPGDGTDAGDEAPPEPAEATTAPEVTTPASDGTTEAPVEGTEAPTGAAAASQTT